MFVTVGMSRWPFDRLVAAADRLADHSGHDVFVQTGTAAVVPRCPHARFLAPEELGRRIAQADVVITHAGNSVRLVQRQGKVPLAVAREPGWGEMGNDHQVRFLASERGSGRVVVLEDLDRLPHAVAEHGALEGRLLAERPPPPPPPEPDELAHRLDTLAFGTEEPPRGVGDGRPFADHILRRLDWAWTRLRDLDGAHLDIGCAHGELVGALASARARGKRGPAAVVGVDPHAGYLQQAAVAHTGSALVRIGIDDRLPFPDAAFASVSLLDALEHVPDEVALLAEVRRVLLPGGTLVVTVPARHRLSFLDPDNAKYRTPRLHRFVYQHRFGPAAYHRRFVDERRPARRHERRPGQALELRPGRARGPPRRRRVQDRGGGRGQPVVAALSRSSLLAGAR
ncbi:MAG: methyltransferase domain-containing protein [Acidimicrobiales bacterium]